MPDLDKKPKSNNIALSIVMVLCASIILAIIAYTLILPNLRYGKAVSLMNEGKYEEAIAVFQKLDDYKDSPDKIAKCEEIILLDNKYNTAISLLNNGKFTEARNAFVELDGYKDSNEMIVKCETAISDEKYNRAVELMKNGNYESAKAELLYARGYKDADDHLARLVTIYDTQTVTYSYMSSMDEYSYEYDDDYNLLKETHRSGVENSHSWFEEPQITEYKYDTDGNVTWESYNYRDISSTLAHEYDAQGRLVKSYSPLPDSDFYEIYEYDENGNLVKDAYFHGYQNSSTTKTYEYDENGNQIKRSDDFDSDGSIDFVVKYGYDSLGNMISLSYPKSEDDNRISTKYEYDSRGNLIKQSQLYEDGTIDSSREYEYDLGGNRTKEIKTTSSVDRTAYYTYTTVYEYDHLGNMIKEVMTNYKGEVFEITYTYEGLRVIYKNESSED